VKPSDLPVQQPTRFDLIVDLTTGWKIWSNEDLITLGIAWRGQFRAGPIKPEVYQPEFDNARKLGLLITVHVASAPQGRQAEQSPLRHREP
jgi:hypothetical protein